MCNGVCEKYPLPETLKKVLYKVSLDAFTVITMSDLTVMKTEAEIPAGEVEGINHTVIIQMYKDLCTSIKEGYAESKWVRTNDFGVLYVDEVEIDVISAEDNVKQVIYLTGEMLKMFRLKYKSKHTLLLILPTIAIILLGLNFNSPYDIVSVWIASVYSIVVNCFLKVKYKRRKNEFA